MSSEQKEMATMASEYHAFHVCAIATRETAEEWAVVGLSNGTAGGKDLLFILCRCDGLHEAKAIAQALNALKETEAAKESQA